MKSHVDADILAALVPGGQLTIAQLADITDMSCRRVRRIVRSLALGRLIVNHVGMRHNAWTITESGSRVASLSHGRASLDTAVLVR